MLVAVVGAQRNRVLKVVSLLQQQQQQQQQISKERIEYLPCVAIFGTYQNEDTNETISYLERFVWFHGDFSNFKPQSLAVIFDKDDDNANDNDNDNDSHSGSCKKDNRPRIPIVAIGCGLDEQNPSTLEQIKNFLITLSGSNHDETAHKTEKDDVLIRCIQPASPPYSSMKEETAVYRAMTAEEKEEVSTRQQKMGPGKMVKFVNHLIHEYHQPDHNINKTVTTATTKQQQQGKTNEEIGSFNDQIKNEGSENEREEQPPLPDVVVEIDLKKPRYACRICREILFGQDDLEDPPHTKQRHSFGYSKVKNFKGLQQQQFKCQSYFLHSPLHWMVMKNTNDHGGEHNGEIESCDNGGTNEGKIICFNCRCKLGQWNWSGAQCSCGTWVVPAIQINCSKVDLIAPEENSLPQQQQQQSYDDQHNFHPLSDSVLQQQQSNTAIMMEPVLPRWS